MGPAAVGVPNGARGNVSITAFVCVNGSRRGEAPPGGGPPAPHPPVFPWRQPSRPW